ncbi:hypothetical protein AADU03_004734 [Escherichia coli]
MKPTIEELMLQILSTCLLISGQGLWKATFYHSALDADVSVSIYPANCTDRLGDRRSHAYYYALTGANNQGRHSDIAEDDACRNLTTLLTCTQKYLSIGNTGAAA